MRDRYQSQRDFERRRRIGATGALGTPRTASERSNTLTSRATKPELVRALLRFPRSKVRLHLTHTYRNRKNGKPSARSRSRSPASSVGSSTSNDLGSDGTNVEGLLRTLRHDELYRLYKTVSERTPESERTRPSRRSLTPPVLGAELLRYLNAYSSNGSFESGRNERS